MHACMYVCWLAFIFKNEYIAFTLIDDYYFLLQGLKLAQIAHIF